MWTAQWFLSFLSPISPFRWDRVDRAGVWEMPFPQVGQAPVTFFLESGPLLWKIFWIYFTTITLPFPWESQELIFLALLWGLGGVSGHKPNRSVGGPLRLEPQKFFTLTLVHTLPPAIHPDYHLIVPTSYGPTASSGKQIPSVTGFTCL